jgi:FkbM family methyltransferase
MIFVSQFIDLACAIGGPRFAFKMYLRRLERWQNFEPEYYMLDHLVDPARAALDVGANEGFYAGRLAQLTKTVHCFEPIPWFAEEIRRKLDPRVVVHQCAVSNRSGSAELRIPYRGDTEFHGNSTLEEGNPLFGSTRINLVPCKLARLDDMISEPVGFIKIDVEGHEISVLEGAQRILDQHKPVLLIESERRHNAQAPESVFHFLQERGYTGMFLERHQMKGLPAFRVETHQRLDDLDAENTLGAVRVGARDVYISNFIFLPNG